MKLKKRSIAIPLFFIKHGKVGGAEEMAYNLIEGLCVNSEVALFIHNEEDLSKNFLSFCRENKIKIFKQKKIFNRFYYTIICISTIGLGDMKPNTLSLKLFTIFLGILIILELVNILANSDADKSDDMEKAKKTIEKLI